LAIKKGFLTSVYRNFGVSVWKLSAEVLYVFLYHEA